MRRVVSVGSCIGGAAVGYVLVVRGALTLDLGLGRRLRPLGPLRMSIAAPRETVFDVIAAPYLGRTPRALGAELDVVEHGSDMVLARHFTPLSAGLTATTVETVRFERPERVAFRLVRGPVPHVLETFELREMDVAEECCGFGGTFSIKFPEVSGGMARTKIDSGIVMPMALAVLRFTKSKY